MMQFLICSSELPCICQILRNEKDLSIWFSAEEFSCKAQVWSSASLWGEARRERGIWPWLSACSWFFSFPWAHLFKCLVSLCPPLSTEVCKFFLMLSWCPPWWTVSLDLGPACNMRQFYSTLKFGGICTGILFPQPRFQSGVWVRNMPTDVGVTWEVLILEKSDVWMWAKADLKWLHRRSEQLRWTGQRPFSMRRTTGGWVLWVSCIAYVEYGTLVVAYWNPVSKLTALGRMLKASVC